MDPTPFFVELRKTVASMGGFCNAHLHLDRAGTLNALASEIGLQTPTADISSLSLSAKHRLIPAIHESSEYKPERLKSRVRFYLDQIVLSGTSRAETLVDVTADRVGLSALDAFLELKNAYAGKLDLRVGAYSPLGFKADEPERWEVLVSGAKRADFVGSLPERDDKINYPDHMGFDEHCSKIVELSQEFRKNIHIHVDQRNDPREEGTRRVIKALYDLGVVPDLSQEPMVWLVHVISPSTYDEQRFAATLQALVELNVGVICCPSAALSMRQLRPIATPTYNSIARVLEMLAAGVHVRLGSDNICDMTSPAGTCDLMNEIFVLSNALRFYDTDVLAALAAGLRLNDRQRKKVEDHLAKDAMEVAQVVEKYS